MNKTIQSSSYRAFSESLLNEWIRMIDTERQRSTSFLLNNLFECLKQFETFATGFSEEAKELARLDKDFQKLGDDKLKMDNFNLWLAEKVSKALDVYWAPLSQAATQYTSPAYKESLADLSSMEKEITGYLNKINHMTGVEGEKAITIGDILLFFDELTLIRLAPYSKTALIGVPFRVTDSTSDSKDSQLAGIAHELGHFLYWRLADFDQIEQRHKDIASNISESLTELLPRDEALEVRFVNAWLEELFADFIGASIAGEVYVLSTKNMVIRNNKVGENLKNNDQEHVSDALRPLVGIYTVNRNREDALKNWRDYFTDQFPADISSLKIKVFREDENQRDIERSPDKLSQTLMHTIDILASKFGNGDNGQLFRPDFSRHSTAKDLARKAIRLANEANKEKREEGEKSPLDYFLEPQALEGGAQSHWHSVKTTSSNTHHGNSAFSIKHT